MAKCSRIGGWFIVFLLVGTLGGLVFRFGSKSGPSTNGAIHSPAPESKATAQPATAATIKEAPKLAAEEGAPAKSAPPLPPEAKPRARWMEGETLWTSPVTTGADGRMSRVRLLKTTFEHPLIRVEEQLAPGENGSAPTIIRQIAMVADHLLVKAMPGVDAGRLAEAVRPLGGSVLSQIPGSEVYLVKITSKDGQSLPNAIQSLGGLKNVIAYAEPDHIVHATATPNDTRFAEQWGLHNTGQSSGTVDADIDAPEAWDITTGSSSVVVAVLDSGMDYAHPDLAANVWANPGETANGKDDDGNGYVDDVRGWSFLNGGHGSPTDSNTHGTHVAGIIGAVGNNGIGTSGVAWQVKLMPVKFIDSSGFGAVSDATSAVNYARVKGAHIINHSWGTPTYSQSLKDAIDAAGAAGILNVCAADNGNGTNEDVTPSYPASFASASVLSVANTTASDVLSSTSDYGPATVHLGAPGTSILSTRPSSMYGPTGLYELNSGTSMATPHVSGIAALLKAHQPSLSGTDLKAILHTSVDVVPGLIGRVTTGGRANARRALDWASDISVVASSSAEYVANQGGPFLPATKVYTLKNHGSASASWTAVLTNAYYASVYPASGTLAAGASVTVTVTLNASLANSAAPGFYDGSLRFTNTTSGKSTTWPMRMDVRLPYLYSFDLNSDPGWSREGAWQFGVPLGQGGSPGNGSPDPTSGKTGPYVFGVNLNGNEPQVLDGPHYLTAGPFDLRGYTQTKLNFWLFLNTNRGGTHTVQIRNDSNPNWQTLWSHPSGPVRTDLWLEPTFNLGTHGDGRSGVYIRWSYESPAENTAPGSGMNIDDIKILGQPGQRLFIDGAAGAYENSGTTTLNLRVEPSCPTDLTVALTSSTLGATTVPATVVVPANTRSISLPVTLVDDALLDGTQTAVLTPTLAGYSSIPWNLEVWDNETSALTLTLPASGTEGSPVEAVISIPVAAARDVAVKLSSSLPGTASPPPTVVIPAGLTQATFTLALPQNSLIETSKTAQITASVMNWTSSSASIVVADDDLVAPTLSFPRAAGDQHLAEGVSTSSYVAKVKLAGVRLVDTVVTLALNDYTEFTLPSSVTIPAGQLSATISPITVTDDALQDGVQTVVVSAYVSGLPTGTTNVTVGDNDVVSLAFGHIPSPQTPGQAIATNISALDVNGRLASGFSGTATVTGHINGVQDAAFTSQTVTFSRGLCNSSFTVATAASAYTFKAVSGTVNATSNAFSLETSPARAVSLTATELAYDEVTNRLYASTSNGTVVPIHPETGAMETPITVSTTYSIYQIEAQGGVLYALLSNHTQMVKVNLATRAVGTPFNVGAISVVDFAILPNDTNTIGVLLARASSGTYDHVAVYTNGVKRPTVISFVGSSTTNPVNAAEITADGTANRFYASDGIPNPAPAQRSMYVLDVSTSGVTLNRTYPSLQTYGNLTGNNGMLADDSGRIYDSNTGNLLGRVGGEALYSMVLDPAMGRACRFSAATASATQGLCVYELTGGSETDRILVGQPTSNVYVTPYKPSRMVWAGKGCVAYRTSSSVVLVKSPQMLDTAQPQPDLAVQQITCPTRPQQGKPMSFNMLVRNNGNAAAADVVLTSDWTPGAEYLGGSTTKGTLSPSDSRVTVNLGTMAPGDTATICVQVIAGTVTNTTMVTSSTAESFTRNNRSIAATSLSSSNSAGSTMTLDTVDLASSKITGRVYATQGFKTGFFAGTLAVLDLDTPAVRAFIPVGSNPGTMAMAENQTELYIALDGTGQVLPFNVSTLAAGTPFSVGASGSGMRLFVKDMTVRPGHPGHLLVSRTFASGTQAGVGLIVNGSLTGTTTAPDDTMHWLAVSADGSTCYAAGTGGEIYPNPVSPTSLHRLTVSAAGVAWAQTRTDLLIGRRIHCIPGKVLSATGQMYDPTTLADAGRLESFSTAYYPAALNLTYDPERERIYTMADQYGSALRAYSSLTLERLTQKSILLEKAPDRMVRWGGRGLALSSTHANASYDLFWISDADLVPELPARISTPAFVMENAGTLSAAGSVQLTAPPMSDLTLTLTSSVPALLQVPSTITIPAGQTSASFNLTVTNDAVVNGARAVTLSLGGATGYIFSPATVEVRDDESGSVAMAITASVTEGAGEISGQASVTLTSGAAAGAIPVQLISSHPDKVSVPAFVVVPAGHTTAPFAFTVLNDDNLDGAQTVTVTASVGGWTAAVQNIHVLDNEPTTITLSSDLSMPEGITGRTVGVQLGGKAVQPLEITITSSHPDRLGFPATITIPVGSATGTAPATVVNNTLKDGRQTVTVTASRAGLTNGTRDVVVIDNDLAVLQWPTIPTTIAGSVIPLTVNALTMDGDPATVTANTTLTTTTTQNGLVLAVTKAPGSVKNLSNNIFTGNARVFPAGSNTVLSVTLGDVTTTSNAFDVVAGPMTSFVWDTMPGPFQAETPLPATVRAVDGYGNALTSFSGTANLSAAQGAVTATVQDTGSTASALLVETSSYNSRMTLKLSSYDIKRAGRLRGLSLEVATPPGRPFTNFLIRAKLTSNYYSLTEWDNAGYTILRQGPLDLTQARGWVEIPFTTPIDYDGTSYLQVDICCSRTSPAAGGALLGSASTSGDCIGSASSYQFGVPQNWKSPVAYPDPHPSSTKLPNLRLSFGSVVSVTPATTAEFVNGMWTGSVTLPQAADDVVLIATSDIAAGQSNAFTVGAPPPVAPVLSAMPVVIADYFGPLSWNNVPLATAYYAEASTDSTFANVMASSGWISNTSYSFGGLTHGTRYYFRVKARKDTGELGWSNIENVTIDLAGPIVSVSNANIRRSGEPGPLTAFTTVLPTWLLTGKAVDSLAGVKTVNIVVNGGSSSAGTFGADGSYAFAVSLPTTGTSHTINIISEDNLNNRTYDNISVTRKADTDANALPDDWQATNGLSLGGAKTGLIDDFDGDGRSNLLEYAFNTPANRGTGTPYPTAANEVNQADGKTYLVYRYDRRRGALDLTYNLEFSTDLATWSGSTFQTEQVGTPTPNADGVTERVVVRILPDISQPQAKKVFVRLAVTSAVP